MLKQLKQLGLALLLAWLLCLSVFAQQAEGLSKQQKQEAPPKPILDAPSLRIPAMPTYQITINDLGYPSVDDLLMHSVQAQSRFLSVAFDGGVLASGSDDGTVKLWNVQSGALIQTLQAQSRVLSVAFDGGVLASGSDDGTVKLWNVQSGALEQISLATGRGAWATIKADGTVLRADAGKILRQGSILAEGEYTVETPERNKDDKPTGKTRITQQTYRSSEWHYLGFPSSPSKALELSLEQTNIELAANKTALVKVQLNRFSTHISSKRLVLMAA